MKTQEIVLASRPKGMPTKNNFEFRESDVPSLKDGEVHLKGLYHSVDPYMRGRMNEGKSYVPPFKVGEPIEGAVIAEVVDSKSPNFKEGDKVQARLPWKKEMVAKGEHLQKIDDSMAPASYYLSILGMTGLTAYFGLLDIGKPKPGETVVVSGAAGAVGSVVGQIAKIKDCRVLGIAGSDAKIKMLKEKFGFDEAINYKTNEDIKGAIAEACPDKVDIYFDNVGGPISDAVVANINFHARIALCGQISLYNATETPKGPRLQPMLLTRSVLMQGFIVGNYSDRFPEGIKQLAEWVKEGKLTFEETIVDGFDKLPEAFLGLFHGDNKGKMVVKA
ncbi:NADP-dependent oxidoreductase [Cryomorpha ignava]|uniref:NADP-dependent oxidoreductase n=1 Tax=Cryomorpha ignava TaxID=101383 RepID=A0A7K3WTE0_9FLAO|nr:NADP-dependent oxidoreductase [Cryomorpha ignava]NEN24959.1 NADP-dependent oxidoreductase [Cryomorpha ignava]